LKLMNEVLKPWLAKIGEEYCRVDAVYSPELDKMVGVEPRDPTNLEFFDAARNHLETKYSSVLKAWEEFKTVGAEYNKNLAVVLEEIRTLAIKELRLPCYYWRPAIEQPKEFIMPDLLAQRIYEEIEWREPQKRKWARCEPLITPAISGTEKVFHLEWNGTLVKSRYRDAVEDALFLINRTIEKPSYQEKANDLKKRKKEVYDAKRENFEVKIKDVIKAIELGNNLKGKCRFCP